MYFTCMCHPDQAGKGDNHTLVNNDHNSRDRSHDHNQYQGLIRLYHILDVHNNDLTHTNETLKKHFSKINLNSYLCLNNQHNNDHDYHSHSRDFHRVHSPQADHNPHVYEYHNGHKMDGQHSDHL